MAGSLVSFRGRTNGKDIHSPSQWEKHPLGRVQFRFKTEGQVVRVFMDIKTMYVFSDTAVRDLQHGRVSGLGLLTDATIERKDGKNELHITIKPLIIGIGALGQADEHGWW